MKRLYGRKSWLATSALTGVMLFGFGLRISAASAQDASGVSEVVVTGSRIVGVTNLTSPSPIAIATHEDIVLSKSTTVEEILDRIPGVDFTGGLSEAKNNGGDGESVVSLRNLGPQRTLTLIDGQRLIPSTGSVDLNAIPASMVDHIEVLKDGASSIYGADAIGGVINIITKKHEDGVTLDAHYGVSGQGDGQTFGLDGAIGLNSDRGNLLIGLNWNHRDPVEQSNRAWATDPHANDPNYPGGSAFRTQLDTLQNENNTHQIWINGVQRSTTDPTVAALLPNTAYINALGVVKLDSGGEGWSFLTGALDQKQINVSSHYDLTRNVTVVAEGFFTDDATQEQLRPEPLLGDTIATFAANGSVIFPGFIVPANAPGNTTGQSFPAYLTPTQFGPRVLNQDSQTYRLRLGFEGKLFDRFNWQFGYVYQGQAEKSVEDHAGQFLHLAQITGQSPCIDVPGGCTNGLPTVMPNFFNGPNVFTPAQVAYLTFQDRGAADSFEHYGYGDINGTLFDLPAGPLKAAIGFELRDEHADQTPSAYDQQVFLSKPTSGGYGVNSVYGELHVPLLKNLPFVKALDFSPSVRFDDYSEFGGQTTYKLGLNYQVSDELRLRTAYATEIRAPQVQELFGGQLIGSLGASGDPCQTGGPDGNGNTGKGVLAAGSTCSKAVAGGAAVINFHDVLNAIPDNQVLTLLGGNPNLQPETARTLTGGFILTPRFAPGLTLAADYYSIIISNTILTGGLAASTTGSADVVLLGCYGAAQNADYCSKIQRDAHGNIIQINSLNTNFGVQKVQGIDYEAAYNTAKARLRLPVPGAVNIDLVVTNQIKNTQTNPDGTVSQANGYFNTDSEQVQPKWKGILTIDYAVDVWKFRWDTRYIRHTWDIAGGVNGANTGVYGDAIPDLWYHDVSVSYDLRNFPMVKQARLIVGVNNLLDQDPPFIGTDSTCKCNTVAGPFDVVGRFFFSRVSTKF